MSVRQFFEQVRTKLLTYRPNVTMRYTDEAKTYHNEPERIVWSFGTETYTRDGNYTRGSRLSPSGTRGALWSRKPVILVEFWVPGILDSDNNEYPSDNGDPSLGTVWLPGVFINVLDELAGENYQLGQANWLPRTDGNLGFNYILELIITTPVYRLTSGTVSTIQTYTQTAEVG